MNEKKVKGYPLEFKQSSAKLASSSEQSISQTAKDLGINVNTLYGWVVKYCSKPLDKKASLSDLDEEVKRLRKENSRLKQERDILKKAAAYFANEIS